MNHDFENGLSADLGNQAVELFEKGEAVQLDATTFGVNIEGHQIRGDGIVFDPEDPNREFGNMEWREHNGEDFVV